MRTREVKKKPGSDFELKCFEVGCNAIRRMEVRKNELSYYKNKALPAMRAKGVKT